MLMLGVPEFFNRKVFTPSSKDYEFESKYCHSHLRPGAQDSKSGLILRETEGGSGGMHFLRRHTGDTNQ